MSFFGDLLNIKKDIASIKALATYLRRGRKPSPEQAKEFAEMIKEARISGNIDHVHIEGLFDSVKPAVKFTEIHPPVGRLNEGGPKMEK